MDGFVSAYSKATGRKQRIPRHWIDHPVFGGRFDLTPSAKAAEKQAPGQDEAPNESWKRDQLDEHATSLGIDPADLRTKADVVAAINEVTARGPFEPDGFVDAQVADPQPIPDDIQDSGDTPSPDQTPATGEEEE